MPLIQIFCFLSFPFPSFQVYTSLPGCGFMGLLIHHVTQIQCRHIAGSVAFPSKPMPLGVRVILKCTRSVGTTVSRMPWAIEAECVCESREVEGQGLVPLCCSCPHCQRQDLSNQVNLISYSRKSMSSRPTGGNVSLRKSWRI